jgi:hypothetical protein
MFGYMDIYRHDGFPYQDIIGDRFFGVDAQKKGIEGQEV